MILLLFVITFLAVVLTGPAGKDWLTKRKALKNRPDAKILPFPYDRNHPRKL